MESVALFQKYYNSLFYTSSHSSHVQCFRRVNKHTGLSSTRQIHRLHFLTLCRFGIVTKIVSNCHIIVFLLFISNESSILSTVFKLRSICLFFIYFFFCFFCFAFVLVSLLPRFTYFLRIHRFEDIIILYKLFM